MEDFIQTNIICPSCSASLSVRIKTGTDRDKVNIVCPVCKTKNRMSAFAEKKTSNDETTLTDETEITTGGKSTGRLVTATGISHRLKEGMNVVGRKAATSDATIQIDTTNRRMSRRHVIIEVVRTGNGSVTHYIENVRDKKNSTTVNGRNVEDDDRLILRNNDRICLAGDELTFITD